jgi:hypothetical protein
MGRFAPSTAEMTGRALPAAGSDVDHVGIAADEHPNGQVASHLGIRVGRRRQPDDGVDPS